jgi:hypothetical protein
MKGRAVTTLLIVPLPAIPSTRPESEADRFRARAARAERRLRRRRWLRLRAALFGRAKPASCPGARPPALRPALGRPPAFVNGT